VKRGLRDSSAGRTVELNAAAVQALIDSLVGAGSIPEVCRMSIVDGAEALGKIVRRTIRPAT
jgi:hypothetical protein